MHFPTVEKSSRTAAAWLASGVLLCALAVSLAVPQMARADMSSKSPSPTLSVEAPSPLASYYRSLQAKMTSSGLLKTDARAPETPWGAEILSRNFLEIAMFSEYSGLSTKNRGKRTLGTLRRWTVPVRVKAYFGASVGAEQRRADLATIDRYARDLGRYTGHPVGMTEGDANVHVLVVSEREIRGIDGLLRRIVPDISESVGRVMRRADPSILCLVVAQPNRRMAEGYKSAVILVRAEHPERLRSSCIQEEMAQAMGLPNDSDRARPSIFNDDEEYAVLTYHDRALLQILYDRRLAAGMTFDEVAAAVPAIAARVAAKFTP